MSENETTAWFDTESLPEAMLNSGFRPLEKSDHFLALKKSMDMSDGTKLLDLGCGVAEAAKVFESHDYTGADLPHIISGAAQVKNPNTNFVNFNANSDSYKFMKNYDIILMNSFLSELPQWYRCLSNVLMHAKKYVIIHRQEVTQNQSYLQEYKTYAGLKTIKTVINYSDLSKLFYFNEFEIMLELNSFPNNEKQKTFLLRKSNHDQ